VYCTILNGPISDKRKLALISNNSMYHKRPKNEIGCPLRNHLRNNNSSLKGSLFVYKGFSDEFASGASHMPSWQVKYFSPSDEDASVYFHDDTLPVEVFSVKRNCLNQLLHTLERVTRMDTILQCNGMAKPKE